MGQLLRLASATGYHIFGHEIRAAQEKEFADMVKRINYRDSVQAVNVLAAFKQNPSAKIVALVGYDHLLEKERDGVKRLATYLRELGGLNPFTVDQTLELARPAGVPGAAPLALTSDGRQPMTWGSNRGYVDLQLVHPPTAMQQGRPAWLGTYDGRVPVIAAVPQAQRGKPYLAQLYDQREYQRHGEKAIPLDQYLLGAQQKQVRLYKRSTQQNVVIRYRPAKL
ncbi:MAG TPA: hypothetical protein VF629_25580 [Hymenobacter sp.]|jgi:hypothetical protein|uniref:hypothetical protein n=1 Tax=Hymenobacter sp. TaxID=1898978 RepID=UPI002ED7C5ED